MGDVIFALGTIEGLVIALFANHTNMQFGAVTGAAIIVPGPGIANVAPGNRTLVGLIGRLAAGFG